MLGAILALVASGFAEILVWFAKSYTVRVTVFAAAVAVIGGAYAAFHAVYLSAAAAISQAAPTGYMWDWAFSCMPSNTSTCLSAISTVATARWVYGNIKALINLSAQVKS